MNYLNMNDEKLLPVVVEMNTLLAEYHMYYQKLRSFHWNITGKNFFDLHNKFEELYGDARLKIDEIAERILTLKYHPITKYSDYISISKVEEVGAIKEDEEMVVEIINDHKILLAQMKVIISHAEEAEDEGTKDMLGSYIGQLEKASWMLNAWSDQSVDKIKNSMLSL